MQALRLRSNELKLERELENTQAEISSYRFEALSFPISLFLFFLKLIIFFGRFLCLHVTLFFVIALCSDKAHCIICGK